MQNIGQVIRYAVATGRVSADPTPALRGALPPCKQTHMASPADDPARVGQILRAVNGFQGGPVVIDEIHVASQSSAKEISLQRGLLSDSLIAPALA